MLLIYSAGKCVFFETDLAILKHETATAHANLKGLGCAVAFLYKGSKLERHSVS